MYMEWSRDSFPAVVSVKPHSIDVMGCYVHEVLLWEEEVTDNKTCTLRHYLCTYMYMFGTISYAIIVTGFVPTLHYYLQILIADLRVWQYSMQS